MLAYKIRFHPITSVDKPSLLIQSVLSWDFLDACYMHFWLHDNTWCMCVCLCLRPLGCQNSQLHARGKRQDEIGLLISNSAKYFSHSKPAILVFFFPAGNKYTETSLLTRVCSCVMYSWHKNITCSSVKKKKMFICWWHILPTLFSGLFAFAIPFSQDYDWLKWNDVI